MTRESNLTGEDSTTRKRILDAAMQLFADHGYSGTPIKAIARACNISDAGVFHHFGTKREILEALLERPRPRLEVHASDEPVRDLRSLDALVLRTLDAAETSEPLLRVLIRQQLVSDPDALAMRDRALANWREVLATWFGLYHPDDTEVLVEAFVNSIMGWLYLMQIQHGAAIGGLMADERFRSEACALVRLSVPIERFELREGRERTLLRRTTEGVS